MGPGTDATLVTGQPGKAAGIVRQARIAAGLSQRELAAASGIAQAVIARIETGVVDPRFATVVRLLAACGVELDLVSRAGGEVDRSQIRFMLSLPKEERARTFFESNRRTLAFLARAIRTRPPRSTRKGQGARPTRPARRA